MHACDIYRTLHLTRSHVPYSLRPTGYSCTQWVSKKKKKNTQWVSRNTVAIYTQWGFHLINLWLIIDAIVIVHIHTTAAMSFRKYRFFLFMQLQYNIYYNTAISIIPMPIIPTIPWILNIHRALRGTRRNTGDKNTASLGFRLPKP